MTPPRGPRSSTRTSSARRPSSPNSGTSRTSSARAANLHLDPDLNDGVVLNIAPLRELVPWKEAKNYWDELMDGKYEWSPSASNSGEGTGEVID